MASARMSNNIGLTELVLIPGARHAAGILTDQMRWLSAVDAFIDRVILTKKATFNSAECNMPKKEESR